MWARELLLYEDKMEVLLDVLYTHAGNFSNITDNIPARTLEHSTGMLKDSIRALKTFIRIWQTAVCLLSWVTFIHNYWQLLWNRCRKLINSLRLIGHNTPNFSRSATHYTEAQNDTFLMITDKTTKQLKTITYLHMYALFCIIMLSSSRYF